ncbi:MAG: 5'/3'-nucleotidase SurE [Gemmatimonadetes bacterium]|uniref:5'-nucleotidase SurE n=1 Tax=Candidatus Kutchimonas denitrificans TaxID=3056748 RepID=A0AAE4Z7K4_9BACT|nr:5'/3'-nucleotidase SurE [Gemmatimonadota bacterium]NIR75260.1 5'/3'-nucleotidase SurE [Candidatus Kutchimonas denitrificans]NIS00198.1 5'/3'-nucleotidase SurE [Gemmatimonadota bacterium]NIT65790.1 5'/3'-nucleotidase SurE [Gemmatimonadota bacterium]NIU53068.1 5'/3'-nucleotidase SurE [Gemmatimonadota bacterium]
MLATQILCTNDDGYLAPGLTLLSRVAARLGDVTVVAPDREQSATSHSLTVNRPLRVRQTQDGLYHVDGTPTDCVLLALGGAIGDRAPDLVLSGVNHGPNLGEDVLYSGTVAAAMESTLLGIPSVALSFASDDFEPPGDEYEPLLEKLLTGIARRSGFPAGTLLNINIPSIGPAEIRGVRVASLGRRVYLESLTRMRDPYGREYFWIGGGKSEWSGRDDSDFRAVAAGYISLTPLHLDLTDYRLIEEIQTWDLTLES